MSEPTYTITSEYDLQDPTDVIPWKATATRIVDGHTFTAWGRTREDAIDLVRGKIRARQADRQIESFDADEDGNPIPQSLRA